jgi:hypothetical protein
LRALFPRKKTNRVITVFSPVYASGNIINWKSNLLNRLSGTFKQLAETPPQDSFIFFVTGTIKNRRTQLLLQGIQNPYKMKKLIYLLFPISACFLFSCSNEVDIANPNDVKDIITQGKWKVNMYVDVNQDQTSDFAGYSFIFSKNGTLIADCNGTNCNGTWTEDAVARKITLNFTNATPVLERINNQWSLAEVNAGLVNMSNNQPDREFLGIAQQ